MERFNQQFLEIRSKQQEQNRLERLLRRVQKQEAEVAEKKQDLYYRLKDEELDVEKLEGMSVKNVFYTVWGKKAEKLEKEKQEVVAAQFKYDAISKEHHELQDEIRQIKDQLAELGDLERQYDQLILEKEELLKTTSQAMLEQLESLVEQKSMAINHQRELKEAINAGNQLLFSLVQVANHLEGAGSWGTLDLLGGGTLSTLAKHAKIDEAKSEINQTQSLLNKFHRELQDVNEVIQLEDLEIGGFLTFADYFFDGLFADWSVQSKIREAEAKTDRTIDQVKQVVNNLNVELHKAESEESRLEQERLDLIEGA